MRFRYRSEEEMKDSRVEWIGKIPNEWKTCSWRYVTKVLTDYTANGSFGDLAKNVKYLDYEDYARLVRLVDLREDLNNPGVYVTKEAYQYLNKSKLDGGEFLIANVGANSGLVCKMPMIEYPCTLAPNMMMAKFNDKLINNDFMIYGANSCNIQQQLKIKATQSSAQPKLNKDDFREVLFAMPSKDMQVKIVNFLDEKTAHFDKIISKKETLIQSLEEAKKSLISEVVTGKVKVIKTSDRYELVERQKEEMKDSGVEWLGDIPTVWDVTKLKYVASIIGGYAFPSDSFKDEGVQIIKIANLYNNKLSLDRQPNYVQESFLETHKEFIAKKDDILISLTGTLGKRDYGYSILLKDNRRFLINQRVGKINFNSNMLIQYGIYVLQSESYLLQLYSLPAGTKQANLSNEQVLSICIALPSKEEQERIYDYLDFQIDKIQQLINKTERQIQKLKEAKQALISEAVTGKIEILD